MRGSQPPPPPWWEAHHQRSTLPPTSPSLPILHTCWRLVVSFSLPSLLCRLFLSLSPFLCHLSSVAAGADQSRAEAEGDGGRGRAGWRGDKEEWDTGWGWGGRSSVFSGWTRGQGGSDTLTNPPLKYVPLRKLVTDTSTRALMLSQWEQLMETVKDGKTFEKGGAISKKQSPGRVHARGKTRQEWRWVRARFLCMNFDTRKVFEFSRKTLDSVQLLTSPPAFWLESGAVCSFDHQVALLHVLLHLPQRRGENRVSRRKKGK